MEAAKVLNFSTHCSAQKKLAKHSTGQLGESLKAKTPFLTAGFTAVKLQ